MLSVFYTVKCLRNKCFNKRKNNYQFVVVSPFILIKLFFPYSVKIILQANMIELEKENERLAKKLKKNQESSTKVCCILYFYFPKLYYNKQ